jgi:hypothetical protein
MYYDSDQEESGERRVLKIWMKQFVSRTLQIIQIQVVSQARRGTRPSMYVSCSPSRPVLRLRLTRFSIKNKYYEEFHETRERSLLHQDYCLCYLCALVVTTWRTLCALVLTTWRTFELLLLHEDPSDHPTIQVGTRLNWNDMMTQPCLLIPLRFIGKPPATWRRICSHLLWLHRNPTLSWHESFFVAWRLQ